MKVGEKSLLKSVEDHHPSLLGLPRASLQPTLQGEQFEVDEKVIDVI